MQLDIDPSKPSSQLRGPHEESDAELHRLPSISGSIDPEADRRAKTVSDLNIQRLNMLSRGKKFVKGSSGSEADIANSPGRTLFQFLEHEQPHNRRPLTDKVTPPQFHAANTRTVSGIVDPTPKFSLPVFGLASYKLKGSIVSPCGPQECEQENSLLQSAGNWLRRLQVVLPDYQF
ncbi:UNVERIFIED_CONTAM: hypothetical protein Sradi_1299900 [Sesamum radiatum]|uniref:Uncharacterized protein n=1 Tax=Sesamum radiatum TaxID=300843 RepID=A0AAW2UPA3_SESRA